MSFNLLGSLSRRAAIKLGLSATVAVAIPEAMASADGPRQLFVTLMSGEPRADSVLLQARFSTSQPRPASTAGGSPGVAGLVEFELSDSPQFRRSLRTGWVQANAGNDFIAKARVSGLLPGQQYYFRAELRPHDGGVSVDPAGQSTKTVGRFRTVRGHSDDGPVTLAVFSCLSYENFYAFGTRHPKEPTGPWHDAAEGEAFVRGYPGLDQIRSEDVDFLIATGDTVYYDHPTSDSSLWATTVPQMRERWQRQFALPAVAQTFASTGAFFMKDDHDFRFDDADNTGTRLPSPEDGRAVFVEQTPTQRAEPFPYRTIRFNRHLQVWLLEGRDFRSPNAAAPGPDKTLWGVEQRRWLERTLLSSSADFKLVVSPTPVIGPDDLHKSDSHASPLGFQYEGEEFLAFLHDNGLAESTHIVNGDRHWQYHSIHRTGVNEFSCGTIHRQNSRYGVPPGSGTDPLALIQQPYLQATPDGGYLRIDAAADGTGPFLRVRFVSEDGDVRHEVRRRASTLAKRAG